MTYAWIIDRDAIAEKDRAPGTLLNAVGVLGPRTIDSGLAEMLTTNREAGLPFRILDDDGVLYYEGRLIWPGWWSDAEVPGDLNQFAPLDDFGRPNAGATIIMYPAPGSLRLVPGSDNWEIL